MLGRRVNLLGDGRAVEPMLAQPKTHVLAHRHVRIERVVLEHHRHVALVRLEVCHRPVVEDHRAGARPLEPGDAGERRALAAA